MIEIQHVSKIYPIDHTTVSALSDVSVSINKGEFVALIGPSGSGKSTLLYILGGLEKPTTGHVLFEGNDVSKMDDNRLSRFRNTHIGFVFQDAILLNHLSVLENVLLPSALGNICVPDMTARARHLLTSVGLANKIDARPLELSGGQRQRTCIAQALILEPQLILADEPTGNLDTHTGAEIIDLFKKLHKEHGSTFVIATHDMAIAERAHRTIAIRDGRITT